MMIKQEKSFTLKIFILGAIGIFLLLLGIGVLSKNERGKRNLPVADFNTTINSNEEIKETINRNGQNEEEQNVILIEPEFNMIQNEIGEQGEENQQEDMINTYYYSQLNESAKIIYDGLKEHKKDLISGNYKIDYDTKFNTLLHTENGQKVLNQAFQSAWNAFSYDNVELFYIDVSKITLTTTITTLGVIETYHVTLGPRRKSKLFSIVISNKRTSRSREKSN